VVTGPDDQVDILTGVERLSFDDGDVEVDSIGAPPVVEFATLPAGNEDEPIGLDLSVTIPNAMESLASVEITGIPEGAVLSAGSLLEGGTWRLTADDLDGLTLDPPANFFGMIDGLTVTATSTETDAAGAPLTSASDFSVLVAPVNDAPELIVNEDADLDISLEAIIDSDLLAATDVDNDPSEIFYRITEGPDFGSLYLFDGEGNWVPVGEDGEGPFTQSDLNAGWLKYVAEGDEVPFSHEWAEGTPEWSGVSERQATTPDPVSQENLTVPDGATSMTVTFEHEGAGYKNTVGWYRIDEEGNPTEANILWNNASAYRSGGSLIRGESSVTIDGLEPGEKIGLFVINNGYNRKFTAEDGSKGKFLREVDEEWTAQFNADGDLTFTGPDRTFTIDADAGGSQGRIFHASLDPSANPDGLVHATSGVDPETGKLMVGFEDLYRGGDKDFDDIVVSVNYDGPSTIVEGDSFSFTVDDGEPPADVDGGYSVAEKEETFNIQVTETT